MSKATSSSAVSSSVSLLGIAGLRVLEVFEFVDERHVFVETVRDYDACRTCGQRAVSGGRHVIQVRDLPVGPKATRLIWHKREWRCRDCGRSWRERHPGIAPRAVLTERARDEAARQVGELGRPVAAVAREFGVGWETIMRAVKDTAARLFADQQLYTVQLASCVAIGVDEKVMNRARRGRRRRYVTVIVHLVRGRPLDIIQGRSKKVLRAWLAAQSPAWRAGVRIAALDPAAPYRAALTDDEVGLPNATLVLDHFHVSKLATTPRSTTSAAASSRRPQVTVAANTTRCTGSASCCSSRPRPSTTPATHGSRSHWPPETPTRRSPAPTWVGAPQIGVRLARHLRRPHRARALLRLGRRGRHR